MENMLASKSDLTVLARNNLTLTGVKKIRSTEPTSVVAQLDNCTIIISGQNLSVQSASISSGELELTGSITSVRWAKTQVKKWSVKNMFR